MSGVTRFDDQLADWLRAEAAAPAPSGLADEIRARTSRRRPRSRWSATLHDVPLTVGRGASSVTAMQLAWFAAALLATLLVIAGVIVGSELLQERRVITTIAPDPLLERDLHHAVRLDDGRVLIVGGSNGSGIANEAALVDPWTGEVLPVPMLEGRSWGPAVTKLDDGRVLIAGGYVNADGEDHNQTTFAEVFDPVTSSFTRTGDMNVARGVALVLKVFVPTTVRLADGRILVIGGTTEQMGSRAYPRPGDVFDPLTDTFTPTAPLPCVGGPSDGDFGQEVRTADLLPDGRILLSCERWAHSRPTVPRGRPSVATGPQDDPAAPEQRFFAFDLETGEAEPVDLGVARVARTMALPDGSLLLWATVGEHRLANGEKRDRYSLSRLDLATLAVEPLGTEVSWGTATALLDDGHVVIAGGYEPGTATPSARVQLLDPCTGGTSSVATLGTTRVDGTVTALDDEHLLVVGGQLGGDPDMYEPVPPEVVTIEEAASPACAR